MGWIFTHPQSMLYKGTSINPSLVHQCPGARPLRGLWDVENRQNLMEYTRLIGWMQVHKLFFAVHMCAPKIKSKEHIRV